VAPNLERIARRALTLDYLYADDATRRRGLDKLVAMVNAVGGGGP
jgi:hypothetical protein